jgi:plasmid stabilization system protein ParE
MAQGSKKHYTPKQKRKAEHIAEGYESRGVSAREAKRRAWSTVNKIHGGGEKKGGGGYGRPENRSVYRKGGRRSGANAAARRKTQRARK